MAKSQSSWIIFYAGCPISWASRLQSQVVLSTTEVMYMVMPQVLPDIISIMDLLQEMREKDFRIICTKPSVYCKVFEDNSGALEFARLPKIGPRTKQANVCYHHFYKHVHKRSSLLTQNTKMLMHWQKLWHKMTSNVIVAMCAASNLSQATKVRECCVIRVLWYLF